MSSSLASTTAVSAPSVAMTDRVVTVAGYIKTAASEPNLDKKRDIFETAFQRIRHEPKSQALYDLLEAYATETCYSQVKGEDVEWGFRASAKLLELAVILQLGQSEYPWSRSTSLQALLENLNTDPFFDTISKLPEDFHVPEEARKSLAKAFVRLAYSYQNIMAHEKNLSLHTKLNAIVEKLIGTETEEQKRQLVDFTYNRCSFMTSIQGGGFQEQFNSYEPVLALIKECYKGDEPIARSLLAQIANMRGICMYQIAKGTPHAFSKAEPYFHEALSLRKALDSELDKNDPLYLKNKRLLKNVVTTLITLNVRRCKESQQQVTIHTEWLKQFINDAKARAEHDSYDTDDLALLKNADSIQPPSRLLAVVNTAIAGVAAASFMTISYGSRALLSRFMIVPAIACCVVAFVNGRLIAKKS